MPAIQIRSATPVWNCNGTIAFKVFSEQVGSTVFFCYHKNKYSEMLNTEENVFGANNSSNKSTPLTERNTVAVKMIPKNHAIIYPLKELEKVDEEFVMSICSLQEITNKLLKELQEKIPDNISNQNDLDYICQEVAQIHDLFKILIEKMNFTLLDNVTILVKNVKEVIDYTNK